MERETATKFIHELLELLVQQKGSDLFITGGFPPAVKIDGKIAPVSKTALTPQHTIEIVRSVMNDKQAAEFESTDRKSTRLNSSHLVISYAVFCLKKKKKRLASEYADRSRAGTLAR